MVCLTACAIGQRPKSAAEIYRMAKSAVVTVRTGDSAGTGFVVDDGHLVVTAYHVIKDTPYNIRVDQTGDSAVLLMGYDEAADVALLQLSRALPRKLALRTGASPDPGTKVFAIGTPLGYLDSTISEGIVSGIRRLGDVTWLQITAPISPGSSGGPVLDEQGRVVGLVKGVIEDGQSLNFAISAFNVRRALNRIKNQDDGIASNREARRSSSEVADLDSFFNELEPSHTKISKSNRKVRQVEYVLLKGVAATFWMYKYQNSFESAVKQKRSIYYLSRNGRLYYRDLDARVHYVTPPKNGFKVPVYLAKSFDVLQGYAGRSTGVKSLARFVEPFP